MLPGDFIWTVLHSADVISDNFICEKSFFCSSIMNVNRLGN